MDYGSSMRAYGVSVLAGVTVFVVAALVTLGTGVAFFEGYRLVAVSVGAIVVAALVLGGRR